MVSKGVSGGELIKVQTWWHDFPSSYVFVNSNHLFICHYAGSLGTTNHSGKNPLSGPMRGWLCWEVTIPWKSYQPYAMYSSISPLNFSVILSSTTTTTTLLFIWSTGEWKQTQEITTAWNTVEEGGQFTHIWNCRQGGTLTQNDNTNQQIQYHPLLTQYHHVPTSTTLYWPRTTKYKHLPLSWTNITKRQTTTNHKQRQTTNKD